MTQDNGLDNPMPISREGLIEALTTARELLSPLIDTGAYAMDISNINDRIFLCEQRLSRLIDDIRSDTTNEYPPVIRREKGKG